MGLWHRVLQFGDGSRGANASYDIFALGIHQELTVKSLFTCGRVAREGNPRSALLTHISEHHGLNVHRSTPAVRDMIELTIGDGTIVFPRAEHRADGPPELLLGILRKLLPQLTLDLCLKFSHELLQVFLGHLRIETDSP